MLGFTPRLRLWVLIQLWAYTNIYLPDVFRMKHRSVNYYYHVDLFITRSFIPNIYF